MFTESMERMELGKFQIDQLALVNGPGRGRLIRGLCRRPCAGGSAASGGLLGFIPGGLLRNVIALLFYFLVL